MPCGTGRGEIRYNYNTAIFFSTLSSSSPCFLNTTAIITSSNRNGNLCTLSYHFRNVPYAVSFYCSQGSMEIAGNARHAAVFYVNSKTGNSQLNSIHNPSHSLLPYKLDIRSKCASCEEMHHQGRCTCKQKTYK